MENEDKTFAVLKHGYCGHCNVNPGTESHTCPYSEEINGDYLSECNCCDECCHECAMEI